jgi:hypothetical protein
MCARFCMECTSRTAAAGPWNAMHAQYNDEGRINTVNSRVCSHVLLPSPSLPTISFISVQKRQLGNCKVQKKLSFP